ncbi:hypothetical protein DSO57_1030184 [Entomophthora muscae]|uniref:Uncharacterized protein n=1 Tax=Entomophthora muscae TaxID=34485 RepID=A0ACC2TC29_9FUNG|nr:hypothetical protein DSO57_1030184 [Entomophthora muscae]
MTDRGRKFIGNEFNRLLQVWYRPTEGLVPVEVQVHGGDARLVIGKVLEEFAVMQAKYKLLISHSPLLGNEDFFKLVPGYDQDTLWGLVTRNPTCSFWWIYYLCSTHKKCSCQIFVSLLRSPSSELIKGLYKAPVQLVYSAIVLRVLWCSHCMFGHILGEVDIGFFQGQLLAAVSDQQFWLSELTDDFSANKLV